MKKNLVYISLGLLTTAMALLPLQNQHTSVAQAETTQLTELITAGSQYYNYDANTGQLLSSGFLVGVPRYIAPCGGKFACATLQTRAFVTLSGQPIESITAEGYYYNYDANTGQLLSSGYTFDIPRYAQGPCQGQPSCKFDTRTFATVNGQLTESITANGQYWNYNANTGQLLSTGNLLDVSRYAQGPCQGQTSCKFDTRTFVTFNGQLTESITANGQYWNYNANTGQLLSTGNLLDVPRYAQGPCSGQPSGTCTFTTRSFASTPTSPSTK